MSTTYGVTPTGFVQKPLEDIKADLEEGFRTTFGAGINLEPASNFGQLIGIFADRLSDVWQLAEAVYNSQYPDSAEGVSLDNVLALSGVDPRQVARKSTVAVTLHGTPSTTIPSGSQASVVGVGTKFSLDANVTLDISGQGFGTMTALDFGPLPAYSGTLTVIETPVAGWSTVTNPLDATLGRLVEDDPDARVRRENELRASANAATEAIRENVLQVDGVTDCFVFENDTDTTDSNGLPPHSIEVLVNGGLDADIAKAIFDSKAAGIQTYTSGGVTTTVTDSQGFNHTIQFTRPTILNMYLIVNLTRDPSRWPSDGVPQVQRKLVDFANVNYVVGSSVIVAALYAPTFSVSGVTDISSILVGTSNPPVSGSNFAVTVRQLAKFDTSRIAVNVS